ncbi:iron-sulfur cluster assembly protein, partial [Thermus scotoductus]|uniref:iron-sulfur cluster assembly protein n=1 Tax=Thermus scotoductus TaxID=37636 RepID=UPI0020A5D840
MVERYWEALKGVKDPEIPVLNIVEMGMVLGVEAEGEKVRVRFRPTFSGCPALRLIREEIEKALREAGAKEVEVVEARTPWSTEDMAEEARRKLLGYGVAPPLPLPLTTLPSLLFPFRSPPPPPHAPSLPLPLLLSPPQPPP